MRTARVLVVEDDAIIASRIAALLEDEGYETRIASDANAGLQAAQEQPFDLILLDVMMPHRDGVSVASELRRRRIAIPILMLTARDAIEDRVRGLDAGADDYLVKPFDPRELKARVRALTRRDWSQRGRAIRVADLCVDTAAQRVERNGQLVKLTKTEWRILEILAANEGRTVPRESLMDSLWEYDVRMDTTLNFHMASLRKKVEVEGSPRLIHTVHGVGYRLSA